MKTKKLHFHNAQGYALSARLESPSADPKAYAIFAHCFSCSKDLGSAVAISRALTRQGIAVLRFDFTGLGQSEGDFADSNFSSNVGDLLAAAEFLAEHYRAPQLLVGHSLGGAAVLQAAKHISSCRAVVTLAAPSEPDHVRKLLQDDEETIRAQGEATVSIAGRPFKIKKQLLDDLEQSSMHEHIHNLHKALLILHSPIDNIVSIDNAATIFKAAKHPKSFVSLDNADHLLSQAPQARYAAQVIAAWAGRYLEDESQAPEHDPKAVLVRTEEGYYSDVYARGHHLLADEPEDVGGSDSGPTPFEYLAAALGACTSITMRMYADRKEWPMEAVEVQVRYRKVPREDGQGKRDRLERKLRIFGTDLDDDQRERLTEIANRCPVHRAIEADIEVVTELMA